MPDLTTDARSRADERDASIEWLNVKLGFGTAGLDPFDAAVMIVEVVSPDRAWRLDLIGHVLETHPHVRADRSTCVRVRALLEADVRQLLGLDEPGAPTLETPLASRSVPAHDAVPPAQAGQGGQESGGMASPVVSSAPVPRPYRPYLVSDREALANADQHDLQRLK